MSIDVKMAWRNIWRNPRRTLLTISAIAFASLLLVFMLSFQFGSYGTMINSSVKIHAGHLQIQAEGYEEKRRMRLVVDKPDKVAHILDSIEQVEAYTFRTNAFSLASSAHRTYGVIVVGVDPAREADVSTIKSLIRKGSYLSEKDTNHAIVGKLLAKNLKVGPGEELTVLGQGRDGSIAATVLTVKGIYSSGIDEFDRSSIYIPIKHFQEVYSMDQSVHKVVVIGKSLKVIPAIKETVSSNINKNNTRYLLAVLDWKELMPGLLQGIQMDLVSGLIFYLILILIVAFSILNTFLMAIFERTREFGVLMAIGTTPGRLTRLLLIESLAMTLIGIISGIILGCVITLFFQSHGIEITGASDILSQYGISGRIYPRLSLLSAITGPAAVLFITFIAAMYPAMKVRKLRPVEAMTYV